MTTSLTILALLTLATTRLTRIITTDRISQPTRRKIVERNGIEGWVSYLTHCSWCVAVWLSLPAALTAWWPGQLGHTLNLDWWWGLPATWLAISYATGWILSKEDN